MSSRTDRVIIAIALIVLLLTLGGIYGFDFLFEKDSRQLLEDQAVAEVIAGSGDVRVKYSDEVRWQKGHQNQKLILNDSVFSGENSQVDLAIGQSRLKLESNTLIVLRQDTLFKSLNLNYGTLTGILAKNDRLMVETSNGEKFELNAGTATKISIKRQAGKTQIRVIEGNAKVTKNGKVQNLSSRDTISFSEKDKVDPLEFTLPAQHIRYSFAESETVHFAWRHDSGRTIQPNDRFTLELSNDSTFRELIMREEIAGAAGFSAPVSFSQDIYYRVKDRAGNYSETRRLQLLQPVTPQIVSPADLSVFDSEAGGAYAVSIGTTGLQPDSKVILQIATDAGFRQIHESKVLLEPRTIVQLPQGEYFLRVRAEFHQLALDGTPLQTEWSKASSLLVREKLDQNILAAVRLPSSVLIPNLKYPSVLYRSKEPDIQNYLQERAPFTRYFAALEFKGHELAVRRAGKSESSLAVRQFKFPAGWISPGKIDFKYQLQTRGLGSIPAKSQTVRIAMESPNSLNAADDGRLTWSPILFAGGYELEIKSPAGTVFRGKSKRAAYFARIKKGAAHEFRVRALGRASQPISDWSRSKSFSLPLPAMEPVIELAENEPLAQRQPAVLSEVPAMTSAKIQAQIESAWKRIGYWLWFGSGFNFFDVRQTVNNEADVVYQNTKGPSVYAEAGYMAKKRFGGILAYKRTPGEVRIDNYPVNNPDFVWDTISLEAIYGLPFVTRIFNQTLNWGVRAGVQHHSFPFLYIETGRNLNNSQSEILAGSLGFFMETTGRWKQHWHMRYQQPIQSSTDGGNSFEIKPKLAFDGSIGTSYLLTERIKTGLFWYGQLHAYDFSYRSPTQSNSGNQSLFYSNMEFRLGIDF